MKKLLLQCAIALGLVTTPAFADYFCPPSCDPCGPCGPVVDNCCGPDWNGLYVGGDVGVFTGIVHLNDFDDFFGVGGTRSLVHTNFTAGVLVGYDWECANKLLGVVADWNWVNIRRRHNAASSFDSSRHNNNWFTTIRARAGVTLCDALVYVTLGAAVHNVKANFTSSGLVAGIPVAGSSISINRTFWGWAGGAGIEYLLGCGWSLGLEVLSLNFSHHSKTGTFATVGGVALTDFRIGVASHSYTGRVILNYRFGDLFGF